MKELDAIISKELEDELTSHGVNKENWTSIDPEIKAQKLKAEEKKLKALERIKEKSMITNEEFERKKQEIHEEFFPETKIRKDSLLLSTTIITNSRATIIRGLNTQPPPPPSQENYSKYMVADKKQQISLGPDFALHIKSVQLKKADKDFNQKEMFKKNRSTFNYK